MEKYVLIVSGGEGKRFQSDRPKQFHQLAGRPMLMHTIDAFSFLGAEIIVVLPDKHMGQWGDLCREHHFVIPHRVVPGGPKRFHSVKSGLKSIPEGVLVAIHDGARPLVSKETIQAAFEMAELKGNGIPAVPVTESLRERDGSLNKAVDRSKLSIIQTPQVFHSTLIKKAYRQSFDERFTDDATVLESAGHQIHLTPGNHTNIKITRIEDLALANHFLNNAG